MLHKISNDLVDITQQASSAKGGNIDESLWQGVQTEILYQRNDCYYWNMHKRLGLNLKQIKKNKKNTFFKKTFSSVNIHAFHQAQAAGAELKFTGEKSSPDKSSPQK